MTKHTTRRNLFGALALSIATVGISTTASADPCDEPTGYVVEPSVVPVAYDDDGYPGDRGYEGQVRDHRGNYRMGRSAILDQMTSDEYELLAQVGASLDRNRDGRLGPSERRDFETLVITLRLFERADRNNSSRLNPEEAGRSRFFAARFAYLDRDRDGHVYKPELVRAVMASLRRGDHYFDTARGLRNNDWHSDRPVRTSWFSAGIDAGFDGGLFVSTR